MSTNVERITHESDTTLTQKGKIILHQKRFVSEQFNFSPDYFFPSEKLFEFFAKYPGMGKFKKAVCKILNFAYSETREEYLHSKKGSLIRLSNTLSAYAYEIVSSDTPLRVIAQDGIFSDEFREFIGPKKYYEELFPWIEESIWNPAIQEFEKLFVQELLDKIRAEKCTFWVKTDSGLKPVYLLEEWNTIVMVTPAYSSI